MTTEHIPLTEQTAWQPYCITEWIDHCCIEGPDGDTFARIQKMDAAEEAVRLLNDAATMRQLLVELTADEEAGIGGSDVATFCVYCNFYDNDTDGPPYKHAPDCPIARGRALVEAARHKAKEQGA